MKLGVLTVPLGGLSLDETCAFLAAQGVQMVEIGCGGCPGKRAVARAKMLVDRGAEAVFLASCIRKGSPIGMPCPSHEAMKAAIEKKLGDAVPVIDWTH